MMKKAAASKGWLRFASILERSNNKLWGCHVRVPKRIAKRLIVNKSRRVVCSVNGSPEFQCAILFYSHEIPVISINKKLRDSLGLDFGIKASVRLKKDESEYGLPVPEELRALFQQDKEGKVIFHALTRGKQRTLLYIIGSAKSPEKRIVRALVIIRHLKANGGKINYKQLGLMMKANPHWE